jgi:hypothetical protein
MSDLTTQVLIEIRDEVRGLRGEVVELRGEVVELRGEVGGLRGEVGGLRSEVGGLRSEVGELRGEVKEVRRRQVDSETRFATVLTDVIGAVNRVRDAVVDGYRFAERVEDHERRISALEQRPID